MRKFAIILICVGAIHAAAQSPAVNVQIDLARSEGVYKPIYSWFGYDESNFTTMKRCMCANHLFTSGNGVPGPELSSWETKNQAMEVQPHLREYCTDLGKRCGARAVRNGGSKKIKSAGAFQGDLQVVSELS